MSRAWPTQLPPRLGAVNAANLAGVAPDAIAPSAPAGTVSFRSLRGGATDGSR